MKCILLLGILLIYESGHAQISNTKVIRIANSTTTFSQPLSEGNILIDINTDKCYLILQAVTGTNSISTLTENTHYKQISARDFQTLDVAQLVGTDLELSLANDGETTIQIDLSSLQDGTGTDDQTAAEVDITDAGSHYTATNVEGALQELGDNLISGGDGWGRDTVVTDATILGSGVTDNILKIDTTIIATKYNLTSANFNANFNLLDADTLSVNLLAGSDLNADLADVDIDSISTSAIEYADTYWDYLPVNINAIQLDRDNPPIYSDYRGGSVLTFITGEGRKISFVAVMPHNYKSGTDITFVIDVTFPTNVAGNVKWDFTHSWANSGDDFPGITSVSTTLAATKPDQNTRLTIATLTGTTQKGSSAIIGSLQRDGRDATDTYNNSAFIISMGFLYQIDKPGSDTSTP